MQQLLQTSPDFGELGEKVFHQGDEVTFVSPVDAHCHGRDNNPVLGEGMTDILEHSARQFGLVLLMPNLVGEDALTTPEKCIKYHDRAWASSEDVCILVTVYLNDWLTESDIKRIADHPLIAGVKSYPKQGTTNSEIGQRTPLDAPKQLQWMEKYGVPLLVHGQVRTDDQGEVLDEWDREPVFYQEVAPELDRRHPGLPISYEHLSTGIGAQAVIGRKGPTQGTFTIPHLGHTRTDVMDSGVRTDMVMKPMIQREGERAQLWAALRKCPERFALGSDDAWHPISAKHSKKVACGGCYGPYRLGYYLDLFEEAEALELFGRFACLNAARFYGVEVPPKEVRMRKGEYRVRDTLSFGKHQAEPLYAGETRQGWHMV